MWYPGLWRQKASYYLYEVYNEFVFVFKKLVFGENTSRLSREATIFLDKKGTVEKMDNYNIVRIYYSRERPLSLPYYILDRLFNIEVARQYRLWFHFFHEKRKSQFIPLPWKIGEILFRGISKNYEFVVQLDQYNFKFAKEIKGFDPNHLFINHMTSVAFSNALTNTFIFGE